MGTVTIRRLYYLEDDIRDGDVPRDDERVETYDELTAHDAVDLIMREGLTFAATGNDWAANPDGSRIVDYATAKREETTAHLAGFSPRVLDAIKEVVG